MALEREDLHAQALITRAAMHASKDSFAKLLKTLSAPPKRRTDPPDNLAGSLMAQLKAAGLPEE